MKTKLHYVLSLAIVLSTFSSFGQQSFFKKVENVKNPESLEKYHINKNKAHFFELDINSFKNDLINSFSKNSNNDLAKTVFVPGENGILESFKVYEKSVFSPELAAKFPNIKSYAGISTDGKGTRLRMSISPQGVQTMITYTDKPRIFMQPVSRGSAAYVIYSRSDKVKSNEAFKCSTFQEFEERLSKLSLSAKVDEGGANTQELQKFDIVISTTSEYTAYHDDGNNGNGNYISDALAAINATLNRVNDIFETDMAVTFQLIAETQYLIFNDAVNDPYSDADIGAADSNSNNQNGWSLQLQNELSSNTDLGNNLAERNAAYDIGHLFGASGGGGNAGCIGCVCVDDGVSMTDKNKGSAFTSPSDGIPEGDTFDLNFVIHEIGHQMGANHTWAFNTEGTGVNSEPGSGSTVMAYAGLEGSNDVQSDSDAYFHYHSINQILTNLSSKSCQTVENFTSNNPPMADAGADFKIPSGTPYILKGSATDSDVSDVLTYCWEQTDSGLSDHSNFGPTLTSAPIARSLPPSTSPNRYIPKLSSVLEGRIAQTNPGPGSDWETVSTVGRILNWALTVRDRTPDSTEDPIYGQSSFDTMQIEVVAGGPFEVTSQSTYTNYDVGSSTDVNWNVANTNSSPISTSQVDILLSVDGGLTYPYTLASGTNNDGMENVAFPGGVSAPFCRIMVVPVGNIYYAVNASSFSIGYNVSTTCNQQFTSNTPESITDGMETTSIINVANSGIISDLLVNVDLEHTWISDLTVKLTHLGTNTSVIIWDENCSGEDNFDIIFEDGAPGIDCASNISGNRNPANLLSTFNGLDMQGAWELSIFDRFAGDEGQLTDWYLDFCTTATMSLRTSDLNKISNLNVFPNPNKGEFTITLNDSQSERLNIEVFDIRGRQIYRNSYKNLGDFNETISLKNAQSGLYILNVSDGNRYATKKIIID